MLLGVFFKIERYLFCIPTLQISKTYLFDSGLEACSWGEGKMTAMAFKICEPFL